jgi:hypothetical protein
VLPEDFTPIAGFLTTGSRPRYAAGDLSGDGIPDLIGVDALNTRRYIGDGNGGFSGLVAAGGNGLPAIVGRTAIVADTRLKLYDLRCTLAPPGFPLGQTFVAGGLCASVVLPGAPSLIQTATLNNRNFVLTVTGSTVSVHEITVTYSGANTTVNAELRSTNTIANIVDVAWSTPGGGALFIFALTDTLIARRLSTAGVLSTDAAFPSIVVDPTPPPDRQPLAKITIGQFKIGEYSVVTTEEKTENFRVLPYSATTGWRRTAMVRGTFDSDNIVDNQQPADVVVGQFNDDSLLDIAVLDRTTGNLIIVRQQPPPCISFITSASHGLLGSPSYTPTARFNRLLAEEMVRANAVRRPASGFRDNATAANIAQCPARFLDVRGHWEQLSGRDTGWLVASRAGWLGGALVPTPALIIPAIPPVLPLPVFEPFAYWASAGWLLIGDVPSIVRFGLGGIGLGTELIASVAHRASSLAASALLNTQLRNAIADANTSMDSCTGNIYLDLLGHSRGGPMITSALRMGLGTRANFNFDLSTTLLDAVDPSIGDQLRPWTKAATMVNDPNITRVGSEWNSSFHGSNSSGEGGIWAIEDFVALWAPSGFIAEFIRADIVGLPKGRARAELTDPARSFGAYQGPLVGIRHKEFAGDPTTATAGTPGATGIGMTWVNPNNSAINNLYAPVASLGASLFAFGSTSHLGTFLTAPRTFSTTGAVGFHTTSSFTTTSEESCFPSGCGPFIGTCPQDISGGVAAAANLRDGQGMIVRELVPDYDFRNATGIVGNAKELYVSNPNLKEIPNPQFDTLRAFIQTTATTSWVQDGTWKRIGTVTFPASQGTVAASMQPYVTDPAVNFSALTSAQQEAQIAVWKQQLEDLNDADTAARITTLSDAAAKKTSVTNAYAQFPVTGSATISAVLSPASIQADELLVRVEYDLGATSLAKVSVSLSGPSLASSATWLPVAGTTRRVAEVIVYRSNAATTGADLVKIVATDAQVFAVSVRPNLPYASTTTNSAFEFVVLESGVSRERAANLAARSVWQGTVGRLARFQSINTLNEMASGVAPDARAWVDGVSSNGAAGSFLTSAGAPVPSSLFGSGTSFSQPRIRGAQAYTQSVNVRYNHDNPGTAVGTNRVGFWVEYVGQGASSAAAAPAAMSMTEGENENGVNVELAEGSGFDAAVDHADELPVAAGPPSCLSMESLVCAPE